MLRVERTRILVCSNVSGVSSLHDIRQLPILVSLIVRSPALVQNQMSGGAFFSCEMYMQGLTPGNLAAVSVVKNSL